MKLLSVKLKLKLERRHVAGLNRVQGKSAWVSAINHGKATPVAVSQLQIGAPISSWALSDSTRNRELWMTIAAVSIRPSQPHRRFANRGCGQP